MEEQGELQEPLHRRNSTVDLSHMLKQVMGSPIRTEVSPEEYTVPERVKRLSRNFSVTKLSQHAHTLHEDKQAQETMDLHVDDAPPCPFCPAVFTIPTLTFVGGLIGSGIGFACNQSGSGAENCGDVWRKLIEFPSQLWINALKLLAFPIISTIMFLIPTQSGDLGKLGFRCLTLYLLTSILAACQGLFWVNVLQPGKGVSFDFNHFSQTNITTNHTTTRSNSPDPLDAFLDIGFKLIPSNIIVAVANSNALGVVAFSASIGMFLPRLPEEQRRVVVEFVTAFQSCLLRLLMIVMRLAPIGVMSATAGAFAGAHDVVEILGSLGKYLYTVVIAHAGNILVVYPIVLGIATRTVAYPYFWDIRDSVLAAFATSSSVASLPTSLRVSRQIGISKEVGEFVLSLGAAINMDGTALGFPIMVLFGAQLFDYDVPAGTQVLVALLGIAMSVGTAPIPSAGLVYLTILLEAAGGPLVSESAEAKVVALVLVWDWLVDRIETITNVLSDHMVAKILDVSERFRGCWCWFLAPKTKTRDSMWATHDSHRDSETYMMFPEYQTPREPTRNPNH